MARGRSEGGEVAVLVPVKAFRRAKARLAPVLDAAARADLARELADRVLAAAGAMPVAVVCDDEDVAEWATAAGAEVVWCPGRGLNGAVSDGYERLGAQGLARVVVAHADLPLAVDFAEVLGRAGVVLVPDRHDDGTNVLVLPTGTDFSFSYGPGSFSRHLTVAGGLGVPVEVVRSPRLRWDLDVPADLALPTELDPLPLRSVAP